MDLIQIAIRKIEIFNNFYRNDCEICYTNKRNTIFLPCKHSYCCDQCANKICMKLNKCPICRLRKKYLIYL